MNMSSRSKSQKTAAPTRQKSRLTEDQLRLLEATFSQEKKLESERKFQLASQLGIPAKQVAVWYQNRRARWKTQSIEYDYLAIRQRLENSLAERETLQNEVSRLRIKFRQSQEIISSISYNTLPPESSSLCSSSKEDNSSNGSSVPINVDCHRQTSESSWQGTAPWQSTGSWQSIDSWQTNGAWPVEDLYACLFGCGEQTTTMSTSSSLFNPGQS